jgi:hypothetical protein
MKTLRYRKSRHSTGIAPVIHWYVLLLVIANSCRSNPPATKTEPSPAEPQAVAVIVPWRIKATPALRSRVPERPTAQQDSSYREELLSYSLPDARTTTPLILAPSDTIDLSNYQSEGWWLGASEPIEVRKLWRFLMDATRFSSGALILKLDTAANRSDSSVDLHTVDSIAVRGLRPSERFASTCRFKSRQVDHRLVGVTPDSVPEKWMRPRLSWFIDTLSVRIRRIRPDSISCVYLPTGD